MFHRRIGRRGLTPTYLATLEPAPCLWASGRLTRLHPALVRATAPQPHGTTHGRTRCNPCWLARQLQNVMAQPDRAGLVALLGGPTAVPGLSGTRPRLRGKQNFNMHRVTRHVGAGHGVYDMRKKFKLELIRRGMGRRAAWYCVRPPKGCETRLHLWQGAV
jgi:hypothetical protein